MKHVLQLLSRFGLKAGESKIYLACLKSGSLFVHEIAKATGVGRSTVDITVARLKRNGFLTAAKSGRRLRYTAVMPEILLQQQRQLADDFAAILPSLMQMKSYKKDMEVMVFEGVEGFIRVHDDVLLRTKMAAPGHKDILAFTSGADTARLYPNINKGFIAKRVQNGSWYKAIATHDSRSLESWASNPRQLRAVKYLPLKLKLNMEAQIYGDSVMLYSALNPVGGAIIRNEQIADSLRMLFHMLWDSLPGADK